MTAWRGFFRCVEEKREKRNGKLRRQKGAEFFFVFFSHYQNPQASSEESADEAHTLPTPSLIQISVPRREGGCFFEI